MQLAGRVPVVALESPGERERERERRGNGRRSEPALYRTVSLAGAAGHAGRTNVFMDRKCLPLQPIKIRKRLRGEGLALSLYIYVCTCIYIRSDWRDDEATLFAPLVNGRVNGPLASCYLSAPPGCDWYELNIMTRNITSSLYYEFIHVFFLYFGIQFLFQRTMRTFVIYRFLIKSINLRNCPIVKQRACTGDKRPINSRLFITPRFNAQ